VLMNIPFSLSYRSPAMEMANEPSALVLLRHNLIR
jgi:hypothetical protein